MRIVDSHTHLDFNDFNNDRNKVIRDAIGSGISDIVISATVAERWNILKTVSHTYNYICHPAYGLHPMFMQNHNIENDLLTLDTWVSNYYTVAIGEIGLDFYIQEADHTHKKSQIELFVAQCEIANAHNLPIIIHTRKSLDIILKHLRRFPNLKGSVHSFSGSEQQAKQLIDLGYYLSFGGPITYSRATRLHKLIKHLPLDYLLVETDSPDQPDANHYKQRNEPAYILDVINKIADIKQIQVEEVALKTSNNADKLFSFKTIAPR